MTRGCLSYGHVASAQILLARGSRVPVSILWDFFSSLYPLGLSKEKLSKREGRPETLNVHMKMFPCIDLYRFKRMQEQSQ